LLGEILHELSAAELDFSLEVTGFSDQAVSRKVRFRLDIWQPQFAPDSPLEEDGFEPVVPPP
jgi:hypothetical protein